MKKTKRDSKQSASPGEILTPGKFIIQNPSYKSANGEFIAKKFRLEFERLTSIHPECKQKAHLSQQVFPVARKKTFVNTNSAKRPRKRRMSVHIVR